MNNLTHLAEFEQALAHYQLSETALHELSQTQLLLLVGATSSGTNRLIRELLKTDDYYYIVSDTTRKPRVNDGVMEQNGVVYWFRDEAAVLEDIKRGRYLEAAIIHRQQVSGISIHELQKATELGKIAVTDTEIAGLDNAIKLKPSTIGIFVLPPNFEEWQRRLRHRGEMHPVEYKRRMQSAVMQFQAALERPYYKFVINDDVIEAIRQINSMAKLDQVDEERQTAAKRLAEQLLVETQSLLRSLE